MLTIPDYHSDQSPGYVDYDPTLKLWASLDFQQSELLDSSINSVTPLWEGTLTQLTGTKVNITVKRVNGTLVADGPTSFVGANVSAVKVPSSLSQLNGSDRVSTCLHNPSHTVSMEAARLTARSSPTRTPQTSPSPTLE